MTRKEHKEMLLLMRTRFIMVSQSAGEWFGFELANEFGKGFYKKFKESQKKVLAN
ncbi:hypothetical protein AAS21_gp201 [Pantoea phage vB_PagS_AAS21]|uniref:Uncharacterized protein n=1 Tax=Pantoea phage vB_PagS_AAS21 TaxID=2575261 RepID=A0A4Y5P1W3_9CAUD|nr:hypothetical protein AAS21_gp201 [Pantoea phage vB_PagS_AAS21]